MARARAEALPENRINPVLLPVMANRMDAVCREMTNTMLLAARSSVIGMARTSPARSSRRTTRCWRWPRASRSTSGAPISRPSRCRTCIPTTGGRCLPAQRPLPRQHPPGRPHHPGAGVPRGRALLHRRGEGAPGRCRQQPADHLHGPGGRRLSGRGADLPLRPGAAGLPGHRRHHPHVRAPHPRARAVVRRLSRRRRRGPRRRAFGQGLHRQVRRPRGAPLHRGVVRLFRAPLHRGHPRTAQGQAQGRADARPGRALGAGRDPDQRDHRHRPRRGEGDGGPARQHRLHRRRPQPHRDHIDHGGGAGGADLPRRGPAAQLRHHAPHRGAAARELRGGDSALPPQLLGRDHQPRRRDRQRDAIRLRRARRRPGLRPRQLLQLCRRRPSPPAPTGAATASATSTRCS